MWVCVVIFVQIDIGTNNGPYKSWIQRTGGRLNKKDGLTRYGNSHVKDKTS